MSEQGRQATGERGLRFLRNAHALAAVALYGAGVLAPVLATPLDLLAGIEAVHAGGLEVARRAVHNRRAA